MNQRWRTLTMHGIAIQGQGNTFNVNIIEYVATKRERLFVQATNLNNLLDALQIAVQESACQ